MGPGESALSERKGRFGVTSYWFDHLYSSDGWRSPGYVSFSVDGRIAEVSGGRPEGAVEHVGGIGIPGVANLHSHAFQRALAGLSEYRTPAVADSFWTWRESMYRFVEHVTPDDLEAIAAQLYVEMLKAGYTAVGEFQYLHHDCDGTPFAEPAEMTIRTMAAAKETGIGATFLPVLYQRGGFGAAPPTEGQRRFINDTDRFLQIHQRVSEMCEGDDGFVSGVAPHSLRAVGEAGIVSVMDAVGAGVPIHMHIAEQEREVADCLAWSNCRPVEWLMDCLPVDDRWCLVHATHVTEEEIAAAALAGITVGLCPTTEANLGDGVFDLPTWMDLGGSFGIGSDSHVSVDPVEELRWLEYGQRLRDRRRNVSAAEGVSTGTRLFDAAVSGGARSLGRGPDGLQVGARGDIVILDAKAPIFAGGDAETFLDRWIFSGNAPVVTDVFVGGAHVVRDGRHPLEGRIARRYRKTLERLLSV